MKRQSYLILVIFSLSLLTASFSNAQPTNNGQPPQGPPPTDQQDEDRLRQDMACNPILCRQCNDQHLCSKCQKGYVLNRRNGTCEDREEYEDRGDGFSLAVGIINIGFIIVVTHVWLFISRKNNNTYINLNNSMQQQNNDQINQFKLQQLQYAQQQNQIIKIGAPSEKTTSEFDIRSKKNSAVQPIDDEKNNIFGNYNKNQQNNSPTQIPVFQIEQSPSGSPKLGPQQSQNDQQQTKFVSDDLNGYWLTQAGKFSFENFNNLHRVKHVMINFMILQRLFASLLVMSGRRGDDDDDDDRKNLLFVGFIVVIILQWLFTFIPPIVIKIFSCCFCLKKDPNGRCASIFLNIIFYIAAIILTIVTTGAIVKMDGFEAQVWILLVLAGFLACIFFDKKSVEFAKSHRNGRMESLIKFRKIDFKNNDAPPTTV